MSTGPGYHSGDHSQRMVLRVEPGKGQKDRCQFRHLLATATRLERVGNATISADYRDACSFFATQKLGSDDHLFIVGVRSPDTEAQCVRLRRGDAEGIRGSAPRTVELPAGRAARLDRPSPLRKDPSS